MTSLKQLSLGSNVFHGPLPSITTMPSLLVLDLQANSMSGSIPVSVCNSSTLQHLLLGGNGALTGTIDTFAPQLKTLLLHRNSFSGRLPNFSRLTGLTRLTLFGNQFSGSLSLPYSTTMSILYVHANRLSCAIDAAGGTSVWQDSTQYTALALPGNAITGPPPQQLHLSAGHASFLYVTGFWEQWGNSICLLTGGLACTVVLVALAPQMAAMDTTGSSREASADAIRSLLLIAREGPSGSNDLRSLSQLQLWCSKAMLVCGVAGLAIMLPIYIPAAQYYECGKVDHAVVPIMS